MTRFQVRHYDQLGSTNDEARRLAAAGAPDGTVVHANQQTAGRGRLARHWFSPPGNVYVSIVLRPDVPPGRGAELGFVAALAVADAVDALLPTHVRTSLKWPNDVLVHGGKIAGILLEQGGDAIIMGIGVNVLHAPAEAPYHVSTIIGSGGLATVDGTRDNLLAALERWLETWQREGFVPVRVAWLKRAHPPGTQLNVRLADQVLAGRFAGLDQDGALQLETPHGRLRIMAGDVQISSTAR